MAIALPARSRRRARWREGLAVALALLGTAVTFRNPWFRGNFGVVAVGRVYRSAQPLAGLPDLIVARGIGTVLNLRGGSDAHPWYTDEVATTRRLGVDFYELPMVATDRPPRRQLLAAIDLLGRCRYPLLIHCKSGSDRTGLVSALYLMSCAGVPPLEAERAFSVYYGHVPLLGTRHLHEPIREYAAWLDAHHLPHEPNRFRAWVATEYRSDDPPGRFDPVPLGPRPARAARIAAGESGGDRPR